jgi:nicotinamidase-related amidase
MNTLIVVDMLNDFINEDGLLYCGPTAAAIVPKVKELVEEVRKNEGATIYLADNHIENDKEFDRFPKHCVRGTHGADIISELDALIHINAGEEILIPKTRYSGFFDTQLAMLLQRIDADDITVVGVCTSICVMDTVGGLANRDYKITVVKDAVADFDQEMHAMALKRMAALYGANVI